MCDSVFAQHEWINGYFNIRFANASKKHDLDPTDFRVKGHMAFLSIELICNYYQQGLIDAEAVFLREKLVTTHAISREIKQSFGKY
jgi:uncharacterized protein (DUF2164 family)